MEQISIELLEEILGYVQLHNNIGDSADKEDAKDLILELAELGYIIVKPTQIPLPTNH